MESNQLPRPLAVLRVVREGRLRVLQILGSYRLVDRIQRDLKQFPKYLVVTQALKNE